MKTNTMVWAVLVALGVLVAGCAFDPEQFDPQCDDNGCAGTGGTGGSGPNLVCNPNQAYNVTCADGALGQLICNSTGTGYESTTCGNSGNGTFCAPNSSVGITCGDGTSGLAYCNSVGSAYDHTTCGNTTVNTFCTPGAWSNIQCADGSQGQARCNSAGTSYDYTTCGGSGTGGTGGGNTDSCNGACGNGTICVNGACVPDGTGGTGGGTQVPATCAGNGVSHLLEIECDASSVPRMDGKGGAVLYGDHAPDVDAQWCGLWTPICTSTNGSLRCKLWVFGQTAFRAQTYLRTPATQSDDECPHGFNRSDRIQLTSGQSCRVKVDGVVLTDDKGQPLASQSVGSAHQTENPLESGWINIHIDVN